MATRLFRFVKRAFIPAGPEDSPRTALNWLILFAPFMLVGLWPHRDFEFWAWMACAAMWTWNITYAFVNRSYWRLFKMQNAAIQIQNEATTRMTHDIQMAYHEMHSHCPRCGQQLKETEVRQ